MKSTPLNTENWIKNRNRLLSKIENGFKPSTPKNDRNDYNIGSSLPTMGSSTHRALTPSERGLLFDKFFRDI